MPPTRGSTHTQTKRLIHRRRRRRRQDDAIHFLRYVSTFFILSYNNNNNNNNRQEKEEREIHKGHDCSTPVNPWHGIEFVKLVCMRVCAIGTEANRNGPASVGGGGGGIGNQQKQQQKIITSCVISALEGNRSRTRRKDTRKNVKATRYYSTMIIRHW